MGYGMHAFGSDMATGVAESGQGAVSQTMAVPSRLPVSRLLPSGETATVVISSVWPVSVRISLPVAGSQSLAVMSLLPVRPRAPSGVKATEVDAGRVAGERDVERLAGCRRPTGGPWCRRCR